MWKMSVHPLKEGMANVTRHLYLSFRSFFGRADVMLRVLCGFQIFPGALPEKE